MTEPRVEEGEAGELPATPQERRQGEQLSDEGSGSHQGPREGTSIQASSSETPTTGKVMTCAQQGDYDAAKDSLEHHASEHVFKDGLPASTMGSVHCTSRSSVRSPDADSSPHPSVGVFEKSLATTVSQQQQQEQQQQQHEDSPPQDETQATIATSGEVPINRVDSIVSATATAIASVTASATAETVVVANTSRESSPIPSTPTELVFKKKKPLSSRWRVSKYASSIGARLKLGSASRVAKQVNQRPAAEEEGYALTPLEENMSKTEKGAEQVPPSPVESTMTFSFSEDQSNSSEGSPAQDETVRSIETTWWHSKRPLIWSVILSLLGCSLLIFAVTYNLLVHLQDRTNNIVIDDEPPIGPPYPDLGMHSGSPTLRSSPAPSPDPKTLPPDGFFTSDHEAPTSPPSSSLTDTTSHTTSPDPASSLLPTAQSSVAPSSSSLAATPMVAPSSAPSSLRGGGGGSIISTDAPTTAAPSQAASTNKTCLSYPEPPPFSGKKGVCMVLRAKGEEGSWIVNLPRVEALKPHWNYKWGLERIDAQPESIEFVPMQWGAGVDKQHLDKGGRRELKFKQELERLGPQIKSGKVKRLLGFNEPDMVSQSNMSPVQAARLWPYLESLGLPLVSPSCAHPQKEWMEEFMKIAKANCFRIDWVGYHWYGDPNVGKFKAKLKSFYEKFGKPVLITEFAVADWSAKTPRENRFSERQVLDFAKEVIPWLEAQDWCVGYSWFSFKIEKPQGSTSALFDEDGSLTTLGRYYASVRADNPTGDQSIKWKRKDKGKKKQNHG